MSSIKAPMPRDAKPFDFKPKEPYPRYPFPIQKPARVNVTVGIGCICDGGKTIVTVCDAMISTGYTSNDFSTLKNVRLTKNWGLLYAGNDISPIVPILEDVKTKLQSCPNRLDNIASTIQRSYQKQVRIKAGRLGKTVKKTQLELEFIAYGYDKNDRAHIFTIGDMNGSVEYYDHVGHCSIGSGMFNANSILDFFGQQIAHSLPLTIYHSLAAKFMAEAAPHVGKATFMIVFKQNGTVALFFPPQIDQIRTLWDAEGKPRVPPDAPKIILGLYSQAEELGKMALERLGAGQW